MSIENYADTFQGELLSLCVLNKFFYSNLKDKLSADIFTTESRKDIFTAIQNHFKSYIAPPDLTMLLFSQNKNNKLEQYKTELEAIYKKRTAAHSKMISDLAEEYLIKTAAKKVALKAVDMIENGQYDLLRKKWNEAMSKSQDNNNHSWLIKDLDYRIKNRNILRGDAISVGLGKGVDDALGGGYYKGTLNLLVGGGGVGKSMCLINIGRAAIMLGLKVVHFTLEMSKEDILNRYDSRFSKIDTPLLFSENNEINLKLKQSFSEAQKSGCMDMLIVDYPSETANSWTFRDKLERLKYQEDYVPDVIIVDYGDIMRSEDSKESSDRVKYSNTFKALRRLAQETKIPVWSATQFNREGMKSAKPNVTDISEDISKIFTCDIALLIAQTEDEELSNTMRVIGGKVRGYKKNWVVTVLADKSKAFIGDSNEFPQIFGDDGSSNIDLFVENSEVGELELSRD